MHYVHLATTGTEAEVIELALRRLLGLQRRANDAEPGPEEFRAALAALDKVYSARSGQPRTTTTVRLPRPLGHAVGHGSRLIASGAFAGLRGQVVEAEGLRSYEDCIELSDPQTLKGFQLVINRELPAERLSVRARG